MQDASIILDFGFLDTVIVYATYICWYADIKTAFKNWHRVLKQGGRLLFVSSHPVTNCLEENAGTITISWNYHNRQPDYYMFEATPVGRRYGVNMKVPTVNFHHTMSDIVNALANAGFHIEQMVEKVEGGSLLKLNLPSAVAIIARK